MLILWELSRATRDQAVWHKLADRCRQLDVALCVGGKMYDLEDPDDSFMLDLGSSLSSRESAVVRQRVLRSTRSNAAAGRPHGQVTYGYRRVYDPRSGALVGQEPNPDEAAVVREAAVRVLAGEGLNRVADDFTARGIPTPKGAKRWWHTTVRRMLTHPAYIGKRSHNGDLHDAVWPPLLDEETWWTLRSMLSDPSRRQDRRAAHVYLLSGVATCGVCDGPVRAVVSKTGPFRYQCAEGFCVKRRGEWVDRKVEAVVVELLQRPETLSVLADGDDQAEVRTALAEKRARLEEFYDLAADDELTPKALARVEAKMLPQIEELEARLSARGRLSLVGAAAGAGAAERWPSLPVEVRRQVVAALVKVRILPTRPGPKFDPSSVEVTGAG